MNIRDWWVQEYQRVDVVAKQSKNSQMALIELFEKYASLSDVDKASVADILVDWLQDDDASKRFDALAIISEFKIKTAKPAMLSLLERLKGSSKPQEYYESKKVQRMIDSLDLFS